MDELTIEDRKVIVLSVGWQVGWNGQISEFADRLGR